ncbi:hypothetical protein RUM44_008888, partial [Polyplax serrata]
MSKKPMVIESTSESDSDDVTVSEGTFVKALKDAANVCRAAEEKMTARVGTEDESSVRKQLREAHSAIRLLKETRLKERRQQPPVDLSAVGTDMEARIEAVRIRSLYLGHLNFRSELFKSLCEVVSTIDDFG